MRRSADLPTYFLIIHLLSRLFGVRPAPVGDSGTCGSIRFVRIQTGNGAPQEWTVRYAPCAYGLQLLQVDSVVYYHVLSLIVRSELGEEELIEAVRG